MQAETSMAAQSDPITRRICLAMKLNLLLVCHWARKASLMAQTG